MPGSFFDRCVEFRLLAFLLAASTCSFAIAQGSSVFSGLPYSEREIREKIAQYSITADSSVDAAWKMPVNLSYQLAFKAILADEGLMSKIDAVDLVAIRNLPAPWDASFLAKDHEELSALCAEAKSASLEEDVVGLATRFDDSRQRRERDLDQFYSSALSQLSIETRELVQNLIAGFARSKNIAHATFDMKGFAEELPEAAKVILLDGCKNFAVQMSSYKPAAVTLGDL